MFGNWPNWVTVFGALLCIGAVVKLMDDALDVQFDFARGKRTLAGRLGRSVTAYVVIFALMAAVLNIHVAVAAFLGSYAVGMFASLRDRMPTHLPAWLETVLALALSYALCGWQTALWGVAMMAVVDWLDDLRDLPVDRVTGQHNMAAKFGFIETLMLVLMALSIAVLTEVTWTLLAFVALPVLEVLAELTTHQLWKVTEDTDLEVDV
jgi:1,4-dihydroxy-2-naphthoate octaprenyltransferase